MSEEYPVLDVIAENADRLCSLDMRPRGYSHGLIHPLYAAAREKVGGPLAMEAAKRIHQAVKPGDTVILTTGAGNRLHLPKGETDGPLGVTAMARILAEGLGAVPVIVTEEACVENLAATAVATGLGVRSLKEVQQVKYTTAVLPFPAEKEQAQRMAADLLDDLAPSAVISIEKLGPNAAGVTHSSTGMLADPARAQVEHLVCLARDRGVLTVGVGDAGNEIGFGLIHEAVQIHNRFGRQCQCPCGQGMATVIATDVLVVSGTSNWGAYAIETCLSAIINKPELIHSGSTEAFMLEENVRTGAADASTFRQVRQVDGTSMEVQLAMNELFRALGRYGLGEPRVRPF